MPSLRSLSPPFPHLPQVALCWETAASWSETKEPPSTVLATSRTEWVGGEGPGIVLIHSAAVDGHRPGTRTARTKPAVPVPSLDGLVTTWSQGGGGGA